VIRYSFNELIIRLAPMNCLMNQIHYNDNKITINRLMTYRSTLSDTNLTQQYYNTYNAHSLTYSAIELYLPKCSWLLGCHNLSFDCFKFTSFLTVSWLTEPLMWACNSCKCRTQLTYTLLILYLPSKKSLTVYQSISYIPVICMMLWCYHLISFIVMY